MGEAAEVVADSVGADGAAVVNMVQPVRRIHSCLKTLRERARLLLGRQSQHATTRGKARQDRGPKVVMQEASVSG